MIHNIIYLLLITLAINWISIIIYILFERFYNVVYFPQKNNLYQDTFENLLNIVKVIVNSEIEAYENDIFAFRKGMTRSQYEQFYKDITSKIINNMSPNLEKQLEKYVSSDMIYRIIARSVKSYLEEKVYNSQSQIP